MDLKNLDPWEAMLLADLVAERLDGVQSGEISGYGQPRDAEVNDTQILLDKIEAMRGDR